jgi:predicted ATP-grasp superfamily ATP-dependent carboligase
MVPVVLLGGLALVRALGLARIPVLIASAERDTPAMASRYCAGTIALPPFEADATSREAAVEALVRAGRELRARHGAPAPLFYGDDERLSLVQDYRAALAPHFALLLNEPALADALLDKTAFQALAERAGLPVPRRVDLHRLQAERFPVLVKPKVKTDWDHSSVHLQLFAGAGKARIFASGAEAAADPLVRSLAGQLAFQEYIPGGDEAIWSFHGFAAPDGEILAWFVGRKIRTYPELTGDSAYLRLARDDAVAALGFELAARLGLAGVFKMDFKRSAASGKLHLLEINARFNLWHYLGACNGVNLTRVAYEFLTAGKRPQPAAAQTRWRWLGLRNDWRAYRELSARGKLNFASWLLSLAYLPKVYETFSWTDPMPFLRYWKTRLHSAATRRLHRWLATAS